MKLKGPYQIFELVVMLGVAVKVIFIIEDIHRLLLNGLETL